MNAISRRALDLIYIGVKDFFMQPAMLSGAANSILNQNVDRATALYRLTDRLYRAQGMQDVYDAALDAITEALGCERASILLFDEAGVMRFVAWRGLSEHYRATLEGHTPWKAGEREPTPIFVTDIDDTSESQKVKDTIKAEGIRALGFVPLVADGGVIGKFMTYYGAARKVAGDEHDLALTVARQIGFALQRNRSDMARLVAEEALRKSEERFRVMSELAPVMIWISDENGACIHLNRKLRDFWNVGQEQISSFDWRTTMHPDDADRLGTQMLEAINKRSPVKVKGRYQNGSGEYRVLQTDAQPRFSEDGAFLGLVGVNIDITERERAEAHRDLLLAELNHRVKNTLAVVQGIAHQTFKPTKSADEAKKDFSGRLLALAQAHDLLMRDSLDRAPLHELAHDLLHTQGMDASRCRITGPNVHLSPKTATSIAMALNELCTNAVKYGALSNDQGVIGLSWSTENGAVAILWEERDGPEVVQPRHRGFGSILLDRTIADVGGSVSTEFRKEGILCRMEVPLAEPPTSTEVERFWKL